MWKCAESKCISIKFSLLSLAAEWGNVILSDLVVFHFPRKYQRVYAQKHTHIHTQPPTCTLLELQCSSYPRDSNQVDFSLFVVNRQRAVLCKIRCTHQFDINTMFSRKPWNEELSTFMNFSYWSTKRLFTSYDTVSGISISFYSVLIVSWYINQC